MILSTIVPRAHLKSKCAGKAIARTVTILYNITMFGNSFSLGLDISDGYIKFVELVKTGNGLKLSRYGERKIPAGIIESGEVKDLEKVKEIFSLLKKQEGLKSSVKDLIMAVENFEAGAEAISRAVIKKGDPETYMIVDFGESRTGIFVVSDGTVMHTSTLEFGGGETTNAIKNNLNATFEEAEKMKQKQGLKRNGKNTKLYLVLLRHLSSLREEINRQFVYWHIHKDENGRNRPPIKKIILCGSDANIPGLSEYLSVTLRNKVELANVWVNVLNTEKSIPEINFEESFKFAKALGVALKDF